MPRVDVHKAKLAAQAEVLLTKLVDRLDAHIDTLPLALPGELMVVDGRAGDEHFYRLLNLCEDAESRYDRRWAAI